MASHIIKLVRSGATLWDFQNRSNNVLSKYVPAPYDAYVKTVEDHLTLNPTGATVVTFLDNLNTYFRAIDDARYNYECWQRGAPYTPIYLQFQQAGSTNVLQTEVLGGDTDAVENYISGALRARLINALPATLLRRPYWEETSAQSIVSTTSLNNGGFVTLTPIRGDVPAPLKITVRSDNANQDRVILAVKSYGTLANYINKYEAEAGTTYGANVGTLTPDTDLSGNAGRQWTPASTAIAADQSLIIWNNSTNVADQLGTYRVYVRCRDLAATLNTRIRVRSGIYTSAGSYQWGDYGDSAKYADGTGVAGGANTSSGGTAKIALVDCGVITIPAVDTQGVAPATIALELRGQVIANGASYKFDIDCLYLMPVNEAALGSGLQIATFPAELGSATTPDAIVDANILTPGAQLSTSAVLQHPASDLRGKPLLAWTNKTMQLYTLTQSTATMRHQQSGSATVTATATPRYRFPGRGT